MEFAVFDTETTGFDPGSGDRVLEIGVVRVDASGRVLRRWSTLLDPGPACALGAVEVHGIDRSMLAGAPRFGEVVGDFVDVVSGAMLTAHNAPFDVKFLTSEFRLAGVEWPEPQVLCTLRAARRVLNLPSYKLAVVADHLGVPFDGRAHSALADAAVTAGVLAGLLTKVRPGHMVWPSTDVRWPSVPPSGAAKLRPTPLAV